MLILQVLLFNDKIDNIVAYEYETSHSMTVYH